MLSTASRAFSVASDRAFFIIGGITGAFLLFIGVTLVVALVGKGERGTRAAQILDKLLRFLRDILRIIWPRS